MSSILAYTTSTDEAPVLGADWAPEEDVAVLVQDDLDTDPFCFVCSRCTDHFGEHDDLVEAGEAFYDTVTGTVYTAAMWHAWANPALRETATV